MLDRIRKAGARRRQAKRFATPEALATAHFRRRSQLDHINFSSMRDVLVLMAGRPQTIIETGTSAWGTDSTMLWDSYVRSFGGELWSVDIRQEAVDDLDSIVGPDTNLTCGDSVEFLAGWAATHPSRQAGVVYLDSWDVDFDDPLPAAEHCLAEVRAIEPALGPGSLLLIDDSPGEPGTYPDGRGDSARSRHEQLGWWPGKGGLAQGYLLEHGAELVHHRYQALYRF